MSDDIIKRVILEAKYMIGTKQTIRYVAGIFNVSKSTVHKDLNDRLKKVDNDLYLEVQKIFKEHIEVRHIRGGESTKKKYLNLTSFAIKRG